MEKLADVKALVSLDRSKDGAVWIRLGDYDSPKEMFDDLNEKMPTNSSFGNYYHFLEYEGCPDWIPTDGLMPVKLAFMDVEDEDMIEDFAYFITLDGVSEYGNDAEKFVYDAKEKMECKADDSSLMDYALEFMDDNKVPQAVTNFLNSKKLLVELAQYLLYDDTVVGNYYFSNH